MSMARLKYNRSHALPAEMAIGKRMPMSFEGSVTDCIGRRKAGDSAAARLGWYLRTVERKLRLIRQIWGQEVAP